MSWESKLRLEQRGAVNAGLSQDFLLTQASEPNASRPVSPSAHRAGLILTFQLDAID